MVRYYRKRAQTSRPAYPGRRTYGKNYRRGGGSSGKYIMRGRKFRMRLKAKGSKYQRFTFFDTIQCAHNCTDDRLREVLLGTADAIHNPAIGAGAAVAHNATARQAYFGPGYAPGGALAAIPGNFDAANNPTQLGDGVLRMIALRDATMGTGRWDYSAKYITPVTIIDGWNAANDVAGGAGLVQHSFEHVFVKGIKINIQDRDQSSPGLVYTLTRSGGDVAKFKESIGRGKLYIKAKKEPQGANWVAAAGPYNLHWKIPHIWISGRVFSRVRITVYYKLKTVLAS